MLPDTGSQVKTVAVALASVEHNRAAWISDFQKVTGGKIRDLKDVIFAFRGPSDEVAGWVSQFGGWG
jgi:hypothetical protein